MKLSASSAWSLEQVGEYLTSEVIPIRLAVLDEDFPLVCSVWFLWDSAEQCILCASHEQSYLVSKLLANPRIGFEIASDDPPYKGVRGKATVTLVRDSVSSVLHNLIDRYLSDRNDSLAKWLLSRVDEEYVIKIEPTWITSWDYSGRMSEE